jgi:hypothetical protein
MTEKKNATTSLRHALALVAPFVMGAALMPIGCSADGGQGVDGENTDTFGATYEEFKASVYQEEDTGVWIVDGDTPIATERELKDFYLKHIQQGALSIATSGGVDQKWTDAQKVNISYCVSQSSFGANYNKVVAAMNAASGAWEAAANVNLVHLTQYDGSCTASQTNVVFDVRQVSGQSYLARAFFPGQARSTRNVLIDTSSFGSLGVWTLEGILRHELGHALGFRHEHTRPEAGTCFEDNSYRPLTPYDSKSVMHYPQCNGTNNGDLVLTASDITGIQSVYGAPGGNPPQPPAGQCEHDKCSAGVKLTAANCDSCVKSVCAADAYCCSTKWDATCVNEVKTICGVTCGAPPPANQCEHDKCVTGVKLTAANCDSCVKSICAADPYCCNT